MLSRRGLDEESRASRIVNYGDRLDPPFSSLRRRGEREKMATGGMVGQRNHFCCTVSQSTWPALSLTRRQ